MTHRHEVLVSGDPVHRSRCHVAMAGDFGWEISVEREGDPLITVRCSDWHKVERLCAWLNRSWAVETPFSIHDVPDEPSSA